MKETSNKLRIGDLIEVLGIVLLCLSVFIGSNFLWIGDLYFSVPITLVIVMALAGIVYALVKLKSAKTYKRERKGQEIIFIILYILIAIPSFYFFTHFMNLQFNLKEDLQAKGKQEIELISDMFVAYDSYVEERAGSYKVKLNTGIKAGDYENIGINVDSSEEEKEVFIEESIIAMKEKFQNEVLTIREEAEEFRVSSQNTIDSWNPIKIPTFFQEVDLKIERFRSGLVRGSREHPEGELEPFKFGEELGSVDVSNVKELLTKVDFANQNWIVTLTAFFLIHFLILWPYLFKMRNSRRINYNRDLATGIVMKNNK